MMRFLLKIATVGMFTVASIACAGGEQADPELVGPIELSESSHLSSGRIVIDLDFLQRLRKQPTWEAWNRNTYELLYLIRRDVPYAMQVGIDVADDTLMRAPPDLGLADIIFPALTSRYHYWLILSCKSEDMRERQIQYLKDHPALYRNVLEFEEGVDVARKPQNCPGYQLSAESSTEFESLSKRLTHIDFAREIRIVDGNTLLIMAGTKFPSTDPSSARLELSNLAHFASQSGSSVSRITVVNVDGVTIYDVTKADLDEEIRKKYTEQ